MSMTMLLETNIFFSTIPYEKMRSWLSLFYDLFSDLKWQYIASCISATVGVHSRWPRYYQKFWLLVFPVSWLCFTPAFSTLPSKNILCSYVLYTHRCFSPVQLYYPLRLSPSLKTRRRRAAGVGGGRRCFMMFLFHFFLLRHLAYGVIRTITYAWSYFAFLMNWSTLAYAMMIYFSLTTIQFCFPRFTAICKNCYDSILRYSDLALSLFMLFPESFFSSLQLGAYLICLLQIWFVVSLQTVIES